MCPAAIIIGFENTAFSVHESDGIFDVYVSVTSPPIYYYQLLASVDLVIQTIDRNASEDNESFNNHSYYFSFLAGGADYQELIAENFDVFLSFNDGNRRARFSVQIFDDNLVEDVEDFNLELRLNLTAPPSEVLLDPGIATVYVLDSDGNN